MARIFIRYNYVLLDSLKLAKTLLFAFRPAVHDKDLGATWRMRGTTHILGGFQREFDV